MNFECFQRMMKGLATKGHLVDVISPYPLKKSHPNYNDLFTLSLGTGQVVNNMTYDIMRNFMRFTLFSVYGLATSAGNGLCDKLLSLPEMQKLIDSPPPQYDAVITEVKILVILYY